MTGQMLSEAWIITACSLSDRLPFQLIDVSIFLKSAGGGAMVLSALVHSILSNVMSRERQAQAFFYLASSSLLTEAIAPPLGSILLEAGSSDTPLLFGFPLELLSLVLISQIPDTSKLLQANYLVSFRVSVNLVLLALILPGISRLLTRHRGMLPAQVDLWIARGSAVFGIIGSMMMGLSAARSIEQLYSPALLLCTLVAATFKLGRSIGGAGLGLPFFIGAAFFVVSGLGIWSASMPDDSVHLTD
ncbi:hypothetical protein BJX76DRAFT_362418 [Aspergillus varians]